MSMSASSYCVLWALMKDMEEALRAGIQRDGAECFLQLALFDPGKELLERHPEGAEAKVVREKMVKMYNDLSFPATLTTHH